MKAWIAHAVLAAGLAAAAPIAAQTAATDAEAQSHILSAFVSGADPRVLADNVTLGPALREQLGAETDSRKVYDALIERSSDKPIRLRALAPGEVVRYASLPGVNIGERLFTLEAGDLVLLLQYASRQKNVAFVEQLSAGAPRTATAAPKPAPIVEVPLPTVPPVVAPPAPLATPAPTPAPVPAPPTPAPAPAAPVAAPAPALTPPAPAAAVSPAVPPAPARRTEKPRPRGECVIKPVMSEEDLWNCSAPVRPVAVERPALPVAVQKPQPPAPEPPKPSAECVIKPVMSDEDMRICAAVSTPRTAAVERPAPPLAVPKPQPPAPETPKPSAECVIKPVMSDEELRACGVRR